MSGIIVCYLAAICCKSHLALGLPFGMNAATRAGRRKLVGRAPHRRAGTIRLRVGRADVHRAGRGSLWRTTDDE